MENKLNNVEEALKKLNYFNMNYYRSAINSYIRDVFWASKYRRDVMTHEATKKVQHNSDLQEKITIAELKNDIDSFLRTIYTKKDTKAQIETNPKWIEETLKDGFSSMARDIKFTEEEAKIISMIPFDEMRKILYENAGFEYTSMADLMTMYKEDGEKEPQDIPEEITQVFHQNGLTLNRDKEVELYKPRHTTIATMLDSFNLARLEKDFDKIYPRMSNSSKRKR